MRALRKHSLEPRHRKSKGQSAPAFLLAQSPIRYGRVRISSTLSGGSAVRWKVCSPVHFEAEVGVCYFEGLAGLAEGLVAAVAPAAGPAVAEVPAASPTWEAVLEVEDECERWPLPERAFARPWRTNRDKASRVDAEVCNRYSRRSTSRVSVRLSS